MVNLDEVISRIKRLKTLPTDKDFASILGLSAPDFSKRKRTGTLLPLIIEWGIAEKVNMDWLLTGKEANSQTPGTSQLPDADREMAELLEMAKEIVNSQSNYTIALMAGIRSFYQSMKSEVKYQALENRITNIEQERKKMLERVRKDDPLEKKDVIIKKRAF